MNKNFLGIALGGGGVRGAAHVGVLQELDRAGIKIDTISGVSAGAVIGAMYAYSLDAKWIEKKFRQIWSSHIVKNNLQKYLINPNSNQSFFNRINTSFNNLTLAFMGLFRNYIFDSKYLIKILDELIPESSFENMKIPLKIIATNISTGEDIVYDSGDVKDAIIKSCAIPGVFKPINNGNNLLVDGGVGMPVPVEPLLGICQFIIAVDIGCYQFQKLKNPNITDLKTRASIITSNRLKKILSSHADYIIRPDTRGFHWSRFEKAETLLDSGKLAVIEDLGILREKIDNNITLT